MLSGCQRRRLVPLRRGPELIRDRIARDRLIGAAVERDHTVARRRRVVDAVEHHRPSADRREEDPGALRPHRVMPVERAEGEPAAGADRRRHADLVNLAVPELRALAVERREIPDPNGAVGHAPDRRAAELEHDHASPSLDRERSVRARGCGNRGRDREHDYGRTQEENARHRTQSIRARGELDINGLLEIRKRRHNPPMRTLPLSLLLLLGLAVAGSAPAAHSSPPRLLGLGISNGGHPFAGDTRELATVSPNRDGLREHAFVHFRLDRPGTVEMQVVATDEVRRPAKLVWHTRRRLTAGPHRLEWTPRRDLPARTYLVRFLVRGRTGKRVYGFEAPRAHQLTSGLVVRILGVEASLPRRSYPQGGPAPVLISTDARIVHIQLYAYASGGERDVNTNAVAVTPSVRLDWRGHRNAPHIVEVGRSGTWPSGLYFLRVVTAGGRIAYSPLILRPRALGEHRVAVVLPTNTWQAYNFRDGDGDGWGDSWYIGGASRAIDLRRPYVEPGLPYRFRDWSSAISSWLKQRGEPVDYLSDDDLAATKTGDDLRRAYDLVVFAGHEEYVTGHMYDVVQRYRDRGGNLMFLSANNFFWKVTRQGQKIRRVKMWRQLGRPEAALVGVQWVAGNIGESEKPYVVEGAGSPQWSWVFDGTGLANGSTFARSGVEVDARAQSSPSNVVVLARIPQAIGAHDAEMTIYRSAAGGRVFAA